MLIVNAQPVARPVPAESKPAHAEAGGGRVRRRDTDDGLPEDLPIVLLGKDGRLYYLIDSTRQLPAVKDTEFGKNKIIALFDNCIPLLTK